MPRPSELPRWATDGGAATEPGEGLKDSGWTTGVKPPAQIQNWLHLVAYQWLDALADESTANIAGIAALSDAAHLNTENHFLLTQRFDPAAATSPVVPFLQVLDLPDTYTGTASNDWRAVLELRLNQTPNRKSVVIWQGMHASTNTELFAITCNADWSPGSQVSTQQHSAFPSHALILRNYQFQTCHVAAGTTPWSDWYSEAAGETCIQIPGDATVDGTLNASSVLASTVEAVINLPGGATSRTVQVPIFPATISSGVTVSSLDVRYHLPAAAGETVRWDLPVPHGASLTRVDVMAVQANSAEINYEVRALTPNWGTPSSSPAFTILNNGGVAQTDAATGNIVVALNCSHTVNKLNNAYQVSITKNGSGAGDGVVACRVVYSESTIVTF